MRRLLVRLTLACAVVAAAVTAGLGLSSRAPWPVITSRATISFLVVVAIGFLAGLILMRTALRRYYERSRQGAALDGARVER